MKKTKWLKKIIAYVLSICIVASSLYATDLSTVWAADETTVYFLNSEGWSDIYGYAYAGGDVDGAWPGKQATAATEIGNNWWKITVPRQASTEPFNVIFFDRNDENNKRVDIYFKDDSRVYGAINGVDYASSKAAEKAISLRKEDKIIDNINANVVNGTRDAYSTIKAVSLNYYYDKGRSLNSSDTAKIKLDDNNKGTNIGEVHSGYYVIYENVEFGDIGASSLTFNYSRKDAGNVTVEFRLGGVNGTPLGKADISSTGAWENISEVTLNIARVTGRLDICVVFTGTGDDDTVCNFFDFKFKKATAENQGYMFLKYHGVEGDANSQSKYVQVVDGNGSNPVKAISDNRDYWERIEIIVNDDNTVSFKSIQSGKYLSVHTSDDNRVYADGESIGDTEKFVIEKIAGTDEFQVGIKSVATGKYLSVDNSEGGDKTIKANADSVSGWEAFHFETANGEWILPTYTSARSAYQPILASSFAVTAGKGTDNNHKGFNSENSGANIGSVDGEDWARYDNVNFETADPVAFEIEYAARGSNCDGYLLVYVDSMNTEPVAKIKLPPTKVDGWDNYVSIRRTVTGTVTEGVHTVYLKADTSSDSNHLANIKTFNFSASAVEYDKDNIALNRTTITSDTAVPDTYTNFTSQEAVDEYPNDSGWVSETGDGAKYFEVQLDGMYEIEDVSIIFGDNVYPGTYPTNFEIQVSRDGNTWITARTVKDWNPSITNGKYIYESKDVCLGKASYIRVYATSLKDDSKGMAIYDFSVHGDPVPGYLSNIALSQDVTASSSNEHEDINAVDGKDTTRWGSTNGDSQWYQIDLDKEYELDSIDFKFEQAYAQHFTVKISNDGNTWSTVKSEEYWNEPGSPKSINDKEKKIGYSIHDINQKAKYVKIEVTGLSAADCYGGVSIWEFEVWGKDQEKADYWKKEYKDKYGIYPVSELRDSEVNGTFDTTLVQNDVLGRDDTYEVVYEPNKSIYFYINPREINIAHGVDAVRWSGHAAEAGLDNQWGAESYNSSAVTWVAQQQATVEYKLPENLDFGSNDSITTEIGCQIYGTTDGVSDLGVKEPKFSIKIRLKVIKSSFVIVDTLMDNGCIYVKADETNAKYEWQKSIDGNTWENVSEKRYDLEIVSDGGKVVNVARDIGGGMYYRVRKQGTEEWSYPYKIPYYNQVQNGSFEYPAMISPDESPYTSSDEEPDVFKDSIEKWPFNRVGDEQQYPNGYKGMVWKTTGPGWQSNNKVGHDIEIINGRWLRTEHYNKVQGQFSVTYDEMYGDNSHGDQFAELNCENVGALYQDILTSPNSTCEWELDHAGRFMQNQMLVVAMSTKTATENALKIEPEKIVAAVKDKELSSTGDGTKVTIDGVTLTVWRVVGDETKGVWTHHTGTYTVPAGDENYLTRFFFVSEVGGGTSADEHFNNTIGNLLDNVKFEMKQKYTIEYYVKGENDTEYRLVNGATENGIVLPYDRVGINNLSYSDGSIDLSKYTLSKAEMNGTPYYMDESGLMTVAYNHDTLKLYYDAATIAVTKKIEGMSEIPKGYNILFTLEDASGTALATKTLIASDFSKVEQNGDEAEGYFATLSFKATELEIADGAELKVTEKLVPKISNTNYYLEQVKIDGEVNIIGTDLYFGNNERISKVKSFTYNVDASNAISFVNVYKSIHKVTVTKTVESTFIETETIEDNSEFKFTLNVKKGDAFINALSYGDGITKTGTGSYTFELKNNESIELEVLDGCTVTVVEDDYTEVYTTTWSAVGSSADVNGRTVTINNVDADTELTCRNEKTYYGDVEVQGFQMNTDNSVGAVSEKSPSFRVVSRACKKLKGSDGKLYEVEAYGTIYSLDSIVKDDYQGMMKLNMAASSDHIYNKDEMAAGVYYYETNVGTYANWTTGQPEDPYYNYFALTFIMKSYSYESMEADMAFRAYARLSNGEIVYGTKVYTTDMYEIADNLYQNTKMGTKKAHDFLYDNVLNVVTMQRNRVDICFAMLNALQVPSTSHPTYTVVNKINKEIVDYVYCQNGYTYSDHNEKFSPKSLTSDELTTLLNSLNDVKGTTHETLFDWIYNETEKYGNANGTYKGFYKEVPYDWDNSIYQKK